MEELPELPYDFPVRKRFRLDTDPERTAFDFQQLSYVDPDAAFRVLIKSDPLTVIRLCQTNTVMRTFCETYAGMGVWKAMVLQWWGEEFTTAFQKVLENTLPGTINWRRVVLAAFYSVRYLANKSMETLEFVAASGGKANPAAHMSFRVVVNEDWLFTIKGSKKDVRVARIFAVTQFAISGVNGECEQLTTADQSHTAITMRRMVRMNRAGQAKVKAVMLTGIAYFLLTAGLYLSVSQTTGQTVFLREPIGCTACQTQSPQHACGQCGTPYCSHKCQARDWPLHREMCGKK